MLPVLYNNNYQIVQTPDTIMILVEMVHDVRVIRMNAQHEPPVLAKWLGDSIGHWEGDTLVVDTTNFNPKNRFRGSSENAQSDRALPARRCEHDSLSRHHRRSRGVLPSHGPWNIHSSPLRVRCMNMRATKATTRCRTFSAALASRNPRRNKRLTEVGQAILLPAGFQSRP